MNKRAWKRYAHAVEQDCEAMADRAIRAEAQRDTFRAALEKIKGAVDADRHADRGAIWCADVAAAALSEQDHGLSGAARRDHASRPPTSGGGGGGPAESDSREWQVREYAPKPNGRGLVWKVELHGPQPQNHERLVAESALAEARKEVEGEG